MICTCELPHWALVLPVQHQLACCVVVLCGSNTASQEVQVYLSKGTMSCVKGSMEHIKMSQLGSC